MIIVLEKNNTGWLAFFQGSDVMPNGVALPLPFTYEASKEIVIADMWKRFPKLTAIRIKKNSV